MAAQLAFDPNESVKLFASVTLMAATGAFQVAPPSSLRDTISDGVFESGCAPQTE
jgi:hypothetical protein